MSIINDALKKVQDNLEKKQMENQEQNNKDISKLYDKLYQQNKEPQQSKEPLKLKETQTPAPSKTTAPAPKPSKPSTPRTPKEPSPFLKIFITLFCLIGIIAGVVFYLSKHPVKTTKSRTSPAKPAPKRTYSKNALVLNGTLEVENKKAALLNDQIYRVGDTVGTMTITAITLDYVEFQNGDQTIKLRNGETYKIPESINSDQ